MQVRIEDKELSVISIISSLRSICSRHSNTVDQKFSNKHSGADIDFDGLVGEYAFCKANNVFLDLTVGTRSGSYDCMANGKRIDIKTTRLQDGSLIGKFNRNPDVDVFVLAIIVPHKTHWEVTFPGWIYADDLYVPSNIVDLESGQAYLVSQFNLKKFL